MLEAIRARTGNTVPILAWDTVSIFMTLRMFGPEEMSGIGDVMPKAHTLAAETGRDIDELVEEVIIVVDYTCIILNINFSAESPNVRSISSCAWTPAYV